MRSWLQSSVGASEKWVTQPSFALLQNWCTGVKMYARAVGGGGSGWQQQQRWRLERAADPAVTQLRQNWHSSLRMRSVK